MRISRFAGILASCILFVLCLFPRTVLAGPPLGVAKLDNAGFTSSSLSCTSVAQEVGKKIFPAKKSAFVVNGSYPFSPVEGFCVNVLEGRPTAPGDVSPALRIIVVSNGKYMLPALLDLPSSPSQQNHPPDNLIMTFMNGLHLGSVDPQSLGGIMIKNSQEDPATTNKQGTAIIMGGLLSTRTNDWLKKLEKHKGSIWFVPLCNPANQREAEIIQTMYALIEFGVPAESVIRALANMPSLNKDTRGLEEQARFLVGGNNWSGFKVLRDRWNRTKIEDTFKSRKLILAGVPFPEYMIRNDRLVFDFVL